MVVHCLFEQSGTFKNQFLKLGFNAYDYDILNDFNETDYQCDLFENIILAFNNKPSLFDNIKQGDLIFAFFPCFRFCSQAIMLLNCTQKQLVNLSADNKINYSSKIHSELSKLYDLFCKLVCIAINRDFKLIIENPYQPHHYLTRYFPIKADIIHNDRTLLGDYFKKPTQYWFINCKPKFNFVSEAIYSVNRCYIDKTSSKVERSLISPYYAERFIKEYIL